MTKKSETPELSAADQQVVADEAAAEVVYQQDLADEDLARLPYQTQMLLKARKECQ